MLDFRLIPHMIRYLKNSKPFRCNLHQTSEQHLILSHCAINIFFAFFIKLTTILKISSITNPFFGTFLKRWCDSPAPSHTVITNDPKWVETEFIYNLSSCVSTKCFDILQIIRYKIIHSNHFCNFRRLLHYYNFNALKMFNQVQNNYENNTTCRYCDTC